MSNFIAEALIAVRADTKPFLAEFKKVVAAAEKTKAEVKIVPNPKGFVAEVNRTIKQMTFAPAKVKLVPDPTGFRSAILKIISETAATLPPVTVGVTAARTSGPAAASAASGGTGGVDRRVATAQNAVNAAAAAGIAARRRMAEALSAEEKRAARLVREQVALTAATNAVKAAALSGVPALLAEAEALERVARAAVEVTIAQQARAAAPAERAAAQAAAQAAALEKEAAEFARVEALKVSLREAANKKMLADDAARIAALEALLKQEVAADRAAEDAMEANRAAADARRAARLKSLSAQSAAFAASQIDQERRLAQVAAGAPQQAEAIARNEALITSEKELATSQQLRAKAARQTVGLAKVEGSVEARLSAARAIERTTTQALVAAEIARNEALASGFDDKIRAAQAELALAEAQARTTASTVAALETEALRAGQLGAGRRALEAFGANLAGLRGAALSAQGAFVATAAAAIAVTKAVQTAAQFNSQLNVFKVTAGATAEQMERVRATAIELGRDITLPGVNASDAAEALTLLSKAGLSVQDSVDGVRGVLQLATAAAIDNSEATTLAASALNSFGLAGDQAVRVADVLANAANASQGSIVDMGVALQQSSAVARQAGLSLEETVAALTLFARAGLRGSDAGTSFRTALIRLINPTAKAQRVIEQLGLNLRDSTGGINLGVFDEFAQKTRNLSAAQRDQALAIIFGQDAIRGAAILAREGASGLDETITGLQKQGTAADLAGARMTGFTGSVENLKNQLNSLGITLGEILIPSLSAVVESIAGMTSVITTVLSPVASAVKGIKSLTDELKELGTVNIAGIDIGIENILNPKETLADAKALFSSVDDVVGGGISNVDVARVKVEQLAASFNKVGGSLELDRTVRDLTALKNSLALGDDESKAFAKDIEVLIKQLQDASSNPEVIEAEFRIKIPPEILSGKPGELAADAAKKGFANNFNLGEAEFGVTNFVNTFSPAGERAAAAFFGAFAAGAAAFLPSVARDIAASMGQLNKLMGEDLDIQIQGGANERQRRLKNLAKQEKRAQEIIARERLRLKPGQQSSADLRAAQQVLKGIQDEEESILDEIEADRQKAIDDREQKAKDAKDRADKADKAFLDSLQPGRDVLERRSIRAENSGSLRLQREVLLAEKKRIQEEIALINQGVKDRKVARDEIAERQTELVQIDADIAEKTDAIADLAFTRKQRTLESRQSAAEAVGDITGQIRIVNRRIREYNKLIRAGRLEGEALRTAVEERNQLKSDREQLEKDFFVQQIDLGQSIFDLTGNKNPLLKALDAAIKETARQIIAAKKAGQSATALRIEMNKLLLQRKELLEEVEESAKEAKGTTAFDLLQGAAETFRTTGGNIIGGGQPFAGPTGFTADLAQFLRRNRPSGASGTGISTPGFRDFGDGLFKPIATAAEKQVSSTNDLIAAIERWIATVNGQAGNSSTATSGLTPQAVNALGQRGKALAQAYDATQARKVREARSGI